MSPDCEIVNTLIIMSGLTNAPVSVVLKALFLDQVTKVIVYIEETNSMADVTFPSLPHVVSLLHYDDVARTPDSLHPPAGYPVICVTVSQTQMVFRDTSGPGDIFAHSTKPMPSTLMKNS